MSLLGAVRAAAADLTAHHRQFALVGGLAVSARSEVRFTRDADLVVVVEDDRGAETVAFELTAIGYELAASVEHDAADRLAAVRLRSRADSSTMVDLLFASSGVEAEIARAADVMTLAAGLAIPVAATGHLIALKLLSADDRTRRQDYGDALALASVASDADWDLALVACELIRARGYARGRDLAQALARLRADSSSR